MLWGMDDELSEDGDVELSRSLGCSLAILYEAAGRGWSALPEPQADADMRLTERSWYVCGEPIQAMIGVTGPDEPIFVARPQGVWRSWMLSIEPDGPHEVAETVTDLPVLLAQVAASRRRSFRWCRYCRNLTPSEHRTERDVCSDCATVVQGAVF